MDWKQSPSFQPPVTLRSQEGDQQRFRPRHRYEQQQHEDDQEPPCKREDTRFSVDPGYSVTPPPSSYHHHLLHHQQQQQDTSSFGFAMHSLDLQNFDESASVDLQQLFPQPSASSSGAATAAAAASAMQPHHHHTPQLPHPLLSFYAPQTPQSTVSSEYFVEGFQNFPSDPSQGIPPFTFMSSSHQPAMFDEREELGMTEMQEVSNLFNNASMMTPPTSIMTPRTSIVSPMHGFPPSRVGTAVSGGSVPTSAAVLMHESSSDDGGSGGSGGMSISANPKFSPDRRKLCCIEGCKSQARAFNRCKRHGGSKRCSHPGCTKSVQSRGLCIRHGGGSRCQESGCTRAAQSHGRCKMHGGGRPCIVEDCEKKAHLKRLCRKHGGGAKCSLEGCDKWAQRQGMCMTHSKHTSGSAASPGTGGRSKGATAAGGASTGSSLSPDDGMAEI